MDTPSWSSALVALDSARTRERLDPSMARRLETVEAEIVERQAFYAHLLGLTHSDLMPGSSYAAGLR